MVSKKVWVENFSPCLNEDDWVGWMRSCEGCDRVGGFWSVVDRVGGGRSGGGDLWVGIGVHTIISFCQDLGFVIFWQYLCL